MFCDFRPLIRSPSDALRHGALVPARDLGKWKSHVKGDDHDYSHKNWERQVLRPLNYVGMCWVGMGARWEGNCPGYLGFNGVLITAFLLG